MTWMNEYEIETAVLLANKGETPNLALAAASLESLARWTNHNSDGWAYWPKPSRAAKRLQERLAALVTTYHRGGSLEDISTSELRQLLTPVRAFRTRQQADFEVYC